MAYVKTIQDLNFVLTKDIVKPILEEIAKDVANLLTRYVEKHWYIKRMSILQGYYDRTYEFLDSITTTEVIQKGNKLSITIYFDYNKMSQTLGGYGMFGSRTNITNNATSYQGKSLSEWLVLWIEEGQDSSIYSMEGIHMFENMSKYLDKKILGIFKNKLTKYGVKSNI
jgi:hypothetical protein